MTSQFYDVKKREKVIVRVSGKCIFNTKSGKRYAFVGLSKSGNKLFRFVTESDYMSARVKIINK